MTTSSEPSAQKAMDGHRRMLALLSEVEQRTETEHRYIASAEAEQLAKTLTDRNVKLPPPVRWLKTFQLAQSNLRLGKEEQAIEGFLSCLKMAGSVVVDPSKKTEAEVKVLFELGIAYMRYGETQNCCLRNHPESCILPIQGKGIHTNKQGSQEAVKCFEHILGVTEPDDPVHLKSVWLLNLAWMTLGEYPDSVPPEHLIPPAAFESKQDFVKFTNVSQRLKLDTFSNCGAVIVDDFDNDHYLDLIVSSWDPRDRIRLFRNDQNGAFVDYTESSGLKDFCGGLNMLQADYDNDGDTDFYVLRGAWLAEVGSHPNSLIRNNGDGTFSDVTLDVGMDQHYPTQTAAWTDFDNDGDLDLYVGNESGPDCQAPCQLYQNENGTFRDVAGEANVTNDRFTKGVSWGDVNEDGFPDLYVSNQGQPNRLYLNNQDGTFSDVAVSSGVAGPSVSFPTWFWDYDNDGHLDLYVSVYTAGIDDLAAFHLGQEARSERSVLYRGDGTGKFQDVTNACGLSRPDATMGANFGDLDNDGFLDFYLGTGYPKYDSLMPSVMYLNQGGRGFVDVTTAGGFGHLQKGHAVAFADLDHDGDQDVFEQMGGAFPGDRFHDALYENPGLGNHWITLRLEGKQSNRSAIGAQICAEIVEKTPEGERVRSVYRHVNSGGSFGASPLRQTVGLGKAIRVESLTVRWPTSGITQTFDDVDLDTHYIVYEDARDLTPMPVQAFRLGGDTAE